MVVATFQLEAQPEGRAAWPAFAAGFRPASDPRRRRLPENSLSEMIKIVAPGLAVVAVAVNVPNVGNVVLFQIHVEALGYID